MAPATLKRAFQAIPNYKLLEKIEEGGMSSVYKGCHKNTGDIVAIKIIKAKFARDATLRKRFEQEFQATSKLVHPNIVQALDFGQDDGAAYLVMEYVDGHSLGERVDREGHLSEEESIAIITQVAQALHYAHRNGMIHRDVKPDNILLKSNGQAKLTDFGLVKDLVGGLKLTGPLSVLGTPHFMAPEQYTDSMGVDPRCDIYSLGSTMYWMVTGELPFQAESALEVLKKQAGNDLLPPRAIVPSLSQHIERAIVKAMSPEPDDRPQTALDFAKSLTPRMKRREAAEPAKCARAAVPTSGQTHFKGIERRAAKRFPLILGTSCSMKTSLVSDDPDSEDAWPAVIQNLSAGGLALVIGRRFERGTMLNVEVHCADSVRSRTLEAAVVRVQKHGFGRWLTGCTLTEPLSAADIQALL